MKLKNNIRISIVTGLALVFGSLFIQTTVKAQTWLPYNYWTMDGTNPLADSMGRSPLDPNYFQSSYVVSPAQTTGVGKYLSFNPGIKTIVASSPLVADTGFTVEFLFRAGADMNQIVQLFSRRDGAIGIRFAFPYFRFTTKSIPTGTSTPVGDTWDIDLEGIGRGTYSYYVDRNWHHLVFKYDAKNGVKELWVDGQLPAGFSKTLTKGLFPSNSTTPNSNICDINTNTTYYKYGGDLDEIAMYGYPLPANMIYKHYNEFVSHQHYSFSNSTIAPPAASPVTAGIDITEYAPGHPTPTVDALTQLKTFPAVRVKPGNTLFPNVAVFDPSNLAGALTSSYPQSTLIQRAKEVQKELVTNFNYALQVTNNSHNASNFGDTNTFDGSWIKMANQNPTWKTSANTYLTQINPRVGGATSSKAYIQCGCLPNNSYLRNSSGQFLDTYGNVITSSKTLSPQTPLDSLRLDGKAQRYYLDQLTKKLTRPLDLIFENGEGMPHWATAGLQADPTTLAAYNASGLNDWARYKGRGMYNLTNAYTSEFRSLPALSNTRYVQYQITGHPIYSWNYQETRTLNSLVNGQRLSSGDLYMQIPSVWRYWQGAAHGWQFLVDSRFVEISLGDNLFAPTVSPGWNIDETTMPRPAQWMGFLKAVGMTGAEYFQAGHFVTKIPYQNPDNYVWQMAIPGYVQAVTSRYEDILRNGYLMPGDVPNDVASNPNQPGYSFYAGDVRKLVVVRKHNTLAKYAIVGTIQPNSNMNGNAELTGMATIKLDGQSLTFQIRRQGSTYIYDRTIPSAPVFYQLDKWHEAKHPYSWSKTFELEAELFDNINSNLEIKTQVPTGTAAGNYTTYTSYVSFKAAAAVEYNFTTRGTAPTTHYLWIRARSKNGAQTGFNAVLDGTTTNSVTCINDTAWNWYRYDGTTGQVLTYNGMPVGNHKISITAINTSLEIDMVTITPTSGAFYATFAQPCSGGGTATATITPGGATTFCQGGNVVLTANTGVSYLWSTGAVTKTITATTSGNYIVTVSNGTSSAVSAPTTITVNSLPTSGFTASGPTALCLGNSVNFTANSNTGPYLWSNGATTKTITVNTAGSYVLTVTGTGGCTAISPATSVTVSGTSVTPIITAGGATTFCQGGNVTLTSSTGSTYLWSNGATTKTITATTAGSYIVTVTQTGGCAGTSAATNVTVNAGPTAGYTASGATSFCAGGSVTFTANATTGTYLWSNGATTRSILVSTAGNYSVTATSTNGCSATSAPTTVSVGTGGATPATITASGPVSFCLGGSVTLTANTGSNYLWSTGATTASITTSSSGSYSVTVSQAGGCSATSSPQVVNVSPAATFTVSLSGPLSFCAGKTVTFSVINSTGPTFVWYKNNVVISGASTSSYTANQAGTYKVRVQLGSCGTFSNPYTVTIPCREGELNSASETGNFIAYPNPFTDLTTFAFELTKTTATSVKIFDISGKLMEVVLDNVMVSEGETKIEYNTSSLSQGVYIAEISTSEFTQRIRIVSVK